MTPDKLREFAASVCEACEFYETAARLRGKGTQPFYERKVIEIVEAAVAEEARQAGPATEAEAEVREVLAQIARGCFSAGVAEAIRSGNSRHSLLSQYFLSAVPQILALCNRRQVEQPAPPADAKPEEPIGIVGGRPEDAPACQPEFEEELRSCLNRHSQENASNTPDFILASFLNGCLAAWNTAVQQRETWYGRDARPCTLGGMVSPVPHASPPTAGPSDEQITRALLTVNGYAELRELFARHRPPLDRAKVLRILAMRLVQISLDRLEPVADAICALAEGGADK